MKSIIVTGATGFIGSALSKHLLRDGKSVYAVGRDSAKLEELRQYGNVHPIVLEMKDYGKLNSMIDEPVDVFYHLAWHGVYGKYLKEYQLQLDNAKLACDAIMAAISIGCKKFVFAGTINEFEIDKFFNADKIEPRFICIYAASKFAADMICRTLAYNYGIEYNAALFARTYGEGNKSAVMPNVIIKQFLENEHPKLVVGNNRYDMIYIDDVVNAFVLIGEKGINQKGYYIGNREIRTFREVVLAIRDVVNPKMELVFGEYQDSLDMDYSIIDVNKLYYDTGFECKADFADSIRRTAEWVKDLDLDM